MKPVETDRARQLGRAAFLLVAAAVYVSAVCYPLRLADSILGWLDQQAGAYPPLAKAYVSQLRPQLAFFFSPLVYKEMVACGFLLALFVVGVAGRLAAPCVSIAHPGSTPPRLRIAHSPIAWAFLLCAYAAVSAMLVSPAFRLGVRTLIDFTLGVLVFAVLSDLRLSLPDVRKYMAGLCACGFLIGAIALLQHLGRAWWFMPVWDDPQQRNRMGSLIGHNTGLSSWLLFPAAYGAYFAVSAHTRLRRALSWLLVALTLSCIVAAQSRAVWLIAALLCPLFARSILHALGRRLRTRTILCVVAAAMALVAVQVVAPRWNPLARHTVPLANRIRNDIVNLDQLRRETRLRIAVVSAGMIARKPFVGYGFGSFQYAYPPAQGEYFLAHADTRLGTTTKRTDLAHNDYLQLLVELGIVGFAIASVVAFLAVRTGWKAHRRLKPGPQRLACVALAYPAVAVSLHAFVDFPMHIMPIALAAVASFALWRSVALEAAAHADSSSGAPSPACPDVPKAAVAPPGRSALALKAAGVLCAVVLTVPAYVFVGREFVSDVYFSEGTSWLETSRRIPPGSEAARQQQYLALSWARDLFRRCVKINPFHGQGYEGFAMAYLNLAQLDYSAFRQAEAAGNRKEAAGRRLSASRNASSAVSQVNNQLAAPDLRYNFTYFVAGQAYTLLWRLEPGNRNLLQSAIRCYEDALRFNHADGGTLQALADLKDRLPGHAAEAERLRMRIFDMDPEFGFRSFFQPHLDKAERGEFDEAERAMERMRSLLPKAWMGTLASAELAMRKALWPLPPAQTTATLEFARAGQLIDSIPAEYADERRVLHLRMRYLAAAGDWQKALEIADRLHADTPTDKDILVWRRHISKPTGNPRQAWPDFMNDYGYIRMLNSIRMYYFPSEYLLAAVQFMRVAEEVDVSPAELIRAATILQAPGFEAVRAQCLDLFRREYPGDAFLASAASAVDSPTTGTAAAKR